MNVASKPRDAAVAERLVIGLASIAILMAGL
jgi:hypothetical protein